MSQFFGVTISFFNVKNLNFLFFILSVLILSIIHIYLKSFVIDEICLMKKFFIVNY